MKQLLSEKSTNIGRQKELDYCKLFTIVVMVVTHMWEECTNIDIGILPKGFFHNLLQFIAGPFGAPMFMTALGIGVLYSKNNTPKTLFKRGVRIFVLAYILDIFRDTLPYTIIAGVNHKFDMNYFLFSLLSGDILQFAGLSFMLIAFFMRLNIPTYVMNCIALFMQLIGFWLANNCPISTNLKYVLGLFYKTSDMYFPLLQWFIYPCFGILFANYLRRTIDKDTIYKSLLIVCSSLLAIYTFTLSINGYNVQYIYSLANDNFYNQNFIKTLFNIPAVIAEFTIIYFIFCKRKFTILENLATFAGKNLTAIYIVQWVLVEWTTHIMKLCFGKKFEPMVSLSVSIIYVILSFLIVKGYLFIKRNLESKNEII